MYIEELPNGKYKFVEYYIDPYSEKRRRVSVTFDKNTPQTRNKAIKKLQEKLEQKQTKKANQDLTFEEVYHQFYQQWILSVKEQTIISHKAIDNRMFKHLPDKILMKNVDRKLIQNIINDLFTQGYSHETLRIQTTRFKQVADYAEEHEIIAVNPVKKIKIPKREKTIEEIEQSKNNYLSKQEVSQIAEYFYTKNNHRMAIMVQILFLTGLRFGELIALTEKDIDAENMTLHVTGTYNHHIKQKTSTKTTGSTRTVIISPDILKRIQDYQRLNRFSLSFTQLRQNEEGYIFLSKFGKLYPLQNFNHHIRQVGKALGFKQKMSSHIFRHSHISLLTEMGMPIKQIMERVGHVDPKTTMKIYTHVTTNMQTKLQEELKQIKL